MTVSYGGWRAPLEDGTTAGGDAAGAGRREVFSSDPRTAPRRM